MKKAGLVLALVLIVSQFGCSPQSSSNSNFELYLTDAPDPYLQNFYVTLDGIYLRSEDRQSWTDNILTEPKRIDLLPLRGKEERLAALNLPAGTYSGFKLVISRVEIVTAERTFTIDMTPAATVALPCHFTIAEDTTTKITLDFDAEQSHSWTGSGYSFNPMITVKNIVQHR